MFHTPAHKQVDPAKLAGQIINGVPQHMVAAPIEPDFYFINGGSVIKLRPVSQSAKDFIERSVSLDDWQSPGDIAIEPRYWNDLREGIEANGMVIA